MPRILLIDDDRLQYALTKQQFKSFLATDYELVWKSTYEEGLAELLSGNYAACLLDYRLGKHDGLELMQAAAKEDCRVPVIFLTAETAANIDIEAMNAGALDYLVKGEFSPQMLERSIRYALKLGETMEALRQLATHDALTGLLNRRVMDEVLREEIERSHRFKHPFSMILMDIDHFKTVNDAHGHLAGDVVLKEVAQRIRKQVHSVDRVVRYGGEEFAILMLEGDATVAGRVAERVRTVVEAQPVKIDDSLSLSVTISAGVAGFPEDADTDGALIAAADKALYEAKATGRNRVVAYRDLQD